MGAVVICSENSLGPPSERMVQPFWLVGREHWCEAVAVDVAEEWNLKMAELYLQLGAAINLIDVHSCTTPLGYAAKNGHIEMAKLLPQEGAEKDLPVYREWATPIAYAQLSNNEKIIMRLR